MKRANDLERRVKGFRIPDAWDVHRDDSSHYLITSLKRPGIDFSSKQRCLDWIRENSPIDFSEVRRERESYLKDYLATFKNLTGTGVGSVQYDDRSSYPFIEFHEAMDNETPAQIAKIYRVPVEALVKKNKEYFVGFSSDSPLERGTQVQINKLEKEPVSVASPSVPRDKQLTCTVPGCSFSAFTVFTFSDHMLRSHGVTDGWLFCPRKGCGFRTLNNRTHRAHLLSAHQYDDEYVECDRVGCRYRTRYVPALRAHLSKCKLPEPLDPGGARGGHTPGAPSKSPVAPSPPPTQFTVSAPQPHITEREVRPQQPRPEPAPPAPIDACTVDGDVIYCMSGVPPSRPPPSPPPPAPSVPAGGRAGYTYRRRTNELTYNLSENRGLLTTRPPRKPPASRVYVDPSSQNREKARRIVTRVIGGLVSRVANMEEEGEGEPRSDFTDEGHTKQRDALEQEGRIISTGGSTKLPNRIVRENEEASVREAELDDNNEKRVTEARKQVEIEIRECSEEAMSKAMEEESRMKEARERAVREEKEIEERERAAREEKEREVQKREKERKREEIERRKEERAKDWRKKGGKGNGHSGVTCSLTSVI
ncbi:hypothetical protein TrRE_jg6124 [Triparma retinervis]|nr:hypothetical protein TrRE_jg6124 [Triparma retinervis]